MSPLRSGFRIEGLGTERLLDDLNRRQIALYAIHRTGTRSLEVFCARREAAALRESAERLGFSVSPLPERGFALMLSKVKRRGALLGLCALMLLLLTLSLRFVWRIEIAGAGAYQGEVRAFLKENGIAPGIAKSALNGETLCAALLYRLPRVAWVRIAVRGVTLRVELTQGVPSPALETEDGTGDIVALCDGVIAAIQVYSGAAAVRPGDTVRAGDILIQGRERGANETQTAVRARGRVEARVWLQAQASVSANEIVSTPTGSEALRTVIASPWLRYLPQEEPSYLASDRETQRVAIGGIWFPLWRERIRYIEVAQELRPRPPEEAQREAGVLALRKLFSFLNENDEMIDKWLDYSMIEGDTILATATAEVVKQIGRFIAD